MGEVLLQWDQQLERGVVSTGADAAALHCRSLWDSLSTAGRLKSVYSIKGHINPIATNLVIMIFIETGAFSQSAALRPRLNTHTHSFSLHHTLLTRKYIHTVSHADSDTSEVTIFQQHYIRWLRDAAALTVRPPQHMDR